MYVNARAIADRKLCVSQAPKALIASEDDVDDVDDDNCFASLFACTRCANAVAQQNRGFNGTHSLSRALRDCIYSFAQVELILHIQKHSAALSINQCAKCIFIFSLRIVGNKKN